MAPINSEPQFTRLSEKVGCTTNKKKISCTSKSRGHHGFTDPPKSPYLISGNIDRRNLNQEVNRSEGFPPLASFAHLLKISPVR